MSNPRYDQKNAWKSQVRNAPSPFVTVAGEVLRTTEKAVMLGPAGRESWIPRVHVENGQQVKAGATNIRIREWQARKNGITMLEVPKDE